MTAQLLLQLDDVERDRQLWRHVLEDMRVTSAEIGTKRVERLLERIDARRFGDGDVARMLAEHQRHEPKAKHLVQLILHAPTTKILERLCEARGLEVHQAEPLSDAEYRRRNEAALAELGELGSAFRRKAGLR